jgi:DNA-binding transcriptional LysR family regulator
MGEKTVNVTLKQLEAFYFSVTSASFTVAAAKLFTTQSAVSKRVIELEQALGVQLVHRMPKGLVPTQAGARLMPIAEESMVLKDRIAREVGLDNEVRGTFRIGVTELVALTWLTRLLRELKLTHPALEIEPVVDAGLSLFAALEANTIDLTILPGTYWGDAYRCVEVGRVEDLWMASPKLDIPDRPLKPNELAEYPVLQQAAGSAKNAFYGSWNREHGFQFKKVFSTNSLTVLRELTIEGLGVSQLAVDYFASDINDGLLRVVRTDPMPPPLIYSAVYRQSGFSRALDVISEKAGNVCNFKRGPYDLAERRVRMMR